MSDFAFPAGPMIGPDSVVISVEDHSGSTINVHVYPDAQNAALKSSGQLTQYYIQPARIVLARRVGSPDLDFSMKAMVKHKPASPDIEYMGGSCTFASTLALPDTAGADILDRLMTHDHPDPPERIAGLFNYRSGDPTPNLQVVPVTHSTVSCVIDHPRNHAGPLSISIQHPPIGSIEIQGRNTFLASFSPAAAEEVVTNLRDSGAPPFVIRYVLTEQFDTGPLTLTTDLQVDVDKLYEAVSAATPEGTPLAADVIDQAAKQAGATKITFPDAGGAQQDSKLLTWLADTDAVKQAVLAMIKDQLFDVAPAPAAAQDGPGPPWWKSVIGASTVTLKKDHLHTGAVLRQALTISGTVAAEQTVEGNLDDLATAAKTNLDKYLTVIEVGGF